MKIPGKVPKRHRIYAHHFEQYILSFIKEYHLIPQGKKLYLAVSAGVDSLALAHVFKNLEIQFELLHFNHGTRSSCIREEQLIRDLGTKWKIPVHVYQGEFDSLQSNFENAARLWRKRIYRSLIEKNGIVFTAHHLDDSFEWSLMQSSKQGSLLSTLGIPLKGRGMRRPFLSVSKRQIKRYARATKILWLEDESNQDIRFERNDLRKNILTFLQKKYPSLLRNYVAQKNELARLLGVHPHSIKCDLTSQREPSKGIVLSAEKMRGHKAEVKKWIEYFSQKKRGEIDRELDKLLSAFDDLQSNSKQNFKGPMHFSGGVLVYLSINSLFVMGEDQKKYYLQKDREVLTQLQNFAQIPFAYIPDFPHLLIGKHQQLKKTSHIIHPLFPLTCTWLKNNNVPYVFAPLLAKEVRQKLLRDAVILASS